jgi:hypothetical protein
MIDFHSFAKYMLVSFWFAYYMACHYFDYCRDFPVIKHMVDFFAPWKDNQTVTPDYLLEKYKDL